MTPNIHYENREIEGERLELRHYEKVLATEDRLEGLKAFAEKRKPVCKGR